MTSTDDQLESYFAALSAVDAVDATGIVLEMLDNGAAAGQITAEVLAPAQVRVGQMWQQGRWSVADEHAATAVTETALAALATAASGRRRSQGAHIAIACAEGEWHTLPARMAAVAGAATDARITVLGPSMPSEQLGRRLAAGDIDLLALSCTMPPNLIGAARCVQAAHEVDVPVLAGGRAFGSDETRAYALGADAWAANPDALTADLPVLAYRGTSIPHEAVLLDAVDDGSVAMAYDRLVATFPRLEAMPASQRARTREDLRWMARFTGAAVLTADVTVLDDLLAWLCDLLQGRVSATVLATSAQVLAETVEPFAPTGAALLRQASARLLPEPTS